MTRFCYRKILSVNKLRNAKKMIIGNVYSNAWWIQSLVWVVNGTDTAHAYHLIISFHFHSNNIIKTIFSKTTQIYKS